MSYIFYFGFKKIPSKPKCWDFQVSGENFLNSSCHFWNSIFIQILQQYSVLSNITPWCIFRSNIIYFDQRHPLKWNFWDFWVLQSKFVKLLMPILNWEVNSSSIIASFFILMTHNSLVNFKLKYFQLWTKNPIKIPILKLIGSLVKIYEILYLFSKPKVSFSSDFALLSNVTKDNSSGLF